MRLQQLWQCDSLQAWNDKHGFSPGAPLDRLAASCNVPFSSSVERRRRTYIMHTSLGIHRYDHTYIYVCMAIHTYTHYTTSTGTPLCCWIYAARGSGDLLLSLSLSLLPYWWQLLLGGGSARVCPLGELSSFPPRSKLFARISLRHALPLVPVDGVHDARGATCGGATCGGSGHDGHLRRVHDCRAGRSPP